MKILCSKKKNLNQKNLLNNIDGGKCEQNGEKKNKYNKIRIFFFLYLRFLSAEEMRSMAKLLMMQLRVPLPNDGISKQIYGVNGEKVPESMMVD